MENNNSSLASEILAELKASCKRWFLAFCIMIILEILTIAGFIWYISLPATFKDIQIKNTSGYASYVGRNLTGGLYNGDN